jgi:hypothetical protein
MTDIYTFEPIPLQFWVVETEFSLFSNQNSTKQEFVMYILNRLR